MSFILKRAKQRSLRIPFTSWHILFGSLCGLHYVGKGDNPSHFRFYDLIENKRYDFKA